MFGKYGKLGHLSFIILTTMLASLLFPSPVLADDPAPPPEITEVKVTPEAATGTGPGTIEGDSVTETPTHESPADVVEALVDAEAVLVDEQGQPIPLVSEEAEEVLIGSDPYFNDGFGTIIGYSASGLCPVIVDICNTSITPLQAAINAAPAGAVVYVEPGTYNESPNIGKSLTLQSTGGQDVTTINLQSGPTYLGSLSISGTNVNVTIDGFTIVGFDAVGSGLASSNIFLGTDLGNITISNNRIRVGNIGPRSNGDDGFGLLTTYNTNPAFDVSILTVTDNTFEPLNATGTRAFYVNPGIDQFVFADNEITGNFTRAAITQADDAVLNNNTVTGNGTSAGLGTWGYPDPDVYGQATFRDNTIAETNNAISIFDTNNVSVENNVIDANGAAVRSIYTGGVSLSSLDASTIVVTGNSLANNTIGVTNGYGTLNGIINAVGNWWGHVSGPFDSTGGIDGCGLAQDNPLGGGAPVSECVLYDPWWTSYPPAGPPDKESDDPAGPPRIIPVTGGQRIIISCVNPSMTLQVGDLWVIFTGLCGYEAVVDPLRLEDLPGSLADGEAFLSAATVTVLKDGRPVDSLPAGASVAVSYPLPESEQPAVLIWNARSWTEEDHTEQDGRIESLLDGPATFVFVTR